MERIKTIKDVVDWGLCIGCGACAYFCDHNGVILRDVEHAGIRPRFDPERCRGCGTASECLSICPGFVVSSEAASGREAPGAELIGPYLDIRQGHAADGEIRFQASSGGALSALALYCLECEGMRFVMHTVMNPDRPWTNATVQSRSKRDLLARAGSRYAPASPCDSLALIEQAGGPCVFIGKPCDAEAVALLRRKRPALDRNLGLVLTFFCAGTPSTRATLDLLEGLSIPAASVGALRYRGQGWPGRFQVAAGNGSEAGSLTYSESWSRLQAYRPFRCHLCPDGLGEVADIACGDAWHSYSEKSDDHGQSLVLSRTPLGREMVGRACAAGYLEARPATASDVIAAQGLVKKRMEVFGRVLAMQMLMIPSPRYSGFPLFGVWSRNSVRTRWKTVLGTLRRLVTRGLWHRRPL